MEYKPFVLEKADLAAFNSPDYLGFVDRTVMEAGLRLLLERRRRKPDFPYPDTKFNPNTGEDLPPDLYRVLYPWFFGRGAEACEQHLRILDDLQGLDDVREEVRSLLKQFVTNLTNAILETLRANQGRCPFRVNTGFRAINELGELVDVDPGGAGAGDLFCAKGLIASGIEGKVDQGKQMFKRYVDAALDLRYSSEQAAGDSELAGHGSCMLALGAVAEIIHRSADDSERAKWADMTAELINFVLDRHYDPETAVFSEYVSRIGAERQTELDPGHANELVGLGLQAVESARDCGIGLSAEMNAAFARAEAEFPRLLIKSFELGYNPEFRGLHKLVDNRNGAPINDDLPWWNLPETMRAAVRAFAVSSDARQKQRLLEIARICSNDYFECYVNPDNMLFPFQTRSGKSGGVIDVAPAIPEGDPLYHTNLALIDMKTVLRRL